MFVLLAGQISFTFVIFLREKIFVNENFVLAVFNTNYSLPKINSHVINPMQETFE